MNQEDEEAKQLLYQDIPIHYVWNETNHIWTERQRSHDTIGRLVTVNPRNQELYALRLLLLRVMGAVSFDDLKTVGDVQLQTFKETAIALNLLQSDTEFRRTIEEAATYQMPKQLRQLFAICCITNFVVPKMP